MYEQPLTAKRTCHTRISRATYDQPGLQPTLPPPPTQPEPGTGAARDGEQGPLGPREGARLQRATIRDLEGFSEGSATVAVPHDSPNLRTNSPMDILGRLSLCWAQTGGTVGSDVFAAVKKMDAGLWVERLSSRST